ERGELEEHLRNAQRLESLGALAGGMAHDFNNVLTTILANADLACDQLDPGHPARPHLDQVTEGAERARELVGQIHAFGRDAPAATGPVAVRDATEEALGLVRTVLPSGAEVELRCDAGQAMVLIPAVQLQQILINLATNAAHALEGGENPRIQVAAECCRIGAEGDGLQPGEYVRIAFADNGPGVPTDVVPRIFDPFFTTKPATKGTGLGLATSRSIALAHGGDLRLAEEEPGACFHLYLPLATADAEPQATPEAVPGGRILLVDDEETIALMSGEMLRSLGYEVTVSIDPADALEEVRRHGPDFDLLLTDQVMPGLTGLELARQSRELEPGLPVLITTGYASDLDYDAVRQVSDADVLLKPYRRGDLRTAVAGAMRGRSGA
ncbi:MAG: response regulator, partial [Armatimonadia bacterium]|nr:response regulator [Armatimonadia bacterium]